MLSATNFDAFTGVMYSAHSFELMRTQYFKSGGGGVYGIDMASLYRRPLGQVDATSPSSTAPVDSHLDLSLAHISLAGLSVIALQNGFTSHAILDQFVSNKPAGQTAFLSDFR